MIPENFRSEYYFKKIDKRIKHLFSGKYVWHALNRDFEFEPEVFGSVENSSIGKRVYIGRGTVVKPHSVVENGVYIGKNCIIGPNAYLRKGTIILNNCEIRAEVKNSIIMNGVKAHHSNSCVLDSILGENVNIAAGYVSANLKFSNNNVMIASNNDETAKNTEIDTMRRKFGAILGDNVKTGILSGTMPGTMVGQDSILYSGVIASGIFPSKSRIKNSYLEKQK